MTGAAARSTDQTTPDPAEPRAARMPPTSQTPRRSLSRRLLWLTVALVLLAEMFAFVPMLARERRVWLAQRITEAQIAVFAAPGAALGLGSPDELMKLVGAVGIRLETPGGQTVAVPADLAAPGAVVDLDRETLPERIGRGFAALVDSRDGLATFTAKSSLRPGATITVTLRSGALHRTLLAVARQVGLAALLTALVAGLLVYLTLLVLLVRPMRHIIGSIAAFRADPERTPPLVPSDVLPLPDDEMAVAGHQLAMMQRELRLALWRNARLAALGTAVAKVSHDLRGTLSPALLAAERLQMSSDPAVHRSGDVLVRAVDRATELVRRTLEFSREGPALPDRRRLPLRATVNEAVEQSRLGFASLRVENAVAATLEVDADQGHLVRILANLVRNAAEAGATLLRLDAAAAGNELSLTVRDNGPGLPIAVQENLFRPFVTGGRRGSTGLGLAIVRDLARAHGGEVTLVETSDQGTCFRLALPWTARRVSPAAAGGQPAQR